MNIQLWTKILKVNKRRESKNILLFFSIFYFQSEKKNVIYSFYIQTACVPYTQQSEARKNIPLLVKIQLGINTGRLWDSSLQPSSPFTVLGPSGSMSQNCPGSAPGVPLAILGSGTHWCSLFTLPHYFLLPDSKKLASSLTSELFLLQRWQDPPRQHWFPVPLRHVSMGDPAVESPTSILVFLGCNVSWRTELRPSCGNN